MHAVKKRYKTARDRLTDFKLGISVLFSYLNRKMTGSASASLKLQCVTIATFSYSLCITCVVATFNNNDNAGGLKAGVIIRGL